MRSLSRRLGATLLKNDFALHMETRIRFVIRLCRGARRIVGMGHGMIMGEFLTLALKEKGFWSMESPCSGNERNIKTYQPFFVPAPF